MAKTVDITGLFEDVAARVNNTFASRTTDPFNVYFSFGHYNEVTAELLSKEAGITTKGKKYPLIWLVMDFVERKSLGGDYYCELPELQIIIAVPTKEQSSTRERIAANFKPRLYPIYEEFLTQLVNSGHFHDLSPEAIPHEKIDRPYWSGGESNSANTANLFNDHIDAIQIRRLRLFVNQPVYGFKIFN